MTLHEYLEFEAKLPGLDEIKIRGVPIWRLVRSRFRWFILDNYPFTVNRQYRIWTQIKNNHRSFCGLAGLILSRKKVNTIFFPHPRLYLVKGLYVERLTDPLIDYSPLGENCVVLERHQNGLHKEPRLHSEHVVFMDFIDNFARFLKPFCKITDRFRYERELNQLIEILEKEYQFDQEKVKSLFLDIVSFFFIRRSLMAPILKRLSPKQIFYAPRLAFLYVTDYCKHHNINTIELQHGVTVGETELYSGDYNRHIDPDFFCVFGKANVGPQFGMPVERVVNIGFPYKLYIKSLNLEHFDENVVLVISEPEISEKVVDLLISFVEYCPDFTFHIRCHPQEKFTPELLRRIKPYNQIMLVDNTLESFCALSQYVCVLGENSTVMYEAMSIGKKVGRLNYGGFHVKETELIHGGTKINSHDDLIRFVKEPYSSENDAKEVYSDFDIDALNRIIQ